MKWLVVCLGVLAACRSTPTPAAPDPVPIGAHVTAADGTLVFYYSPDQPLESYATGDRGAYVVSIEGDASLAALPDVGTHLEGTRWVYRLTDEERTRVEALPFATVVGPLAPEQRYDPERTPSGEVLVELFSDSSPAVTQAVADLLGSWGAPAEIVAPNTLRTTIAPGALPAITRISAIRWIEPR